LSRSQWFPVYRPGGVDEPCAAPAKKDNITKGLQRCGWFGPLSGFGGRLAVQAYAWRIETRVPGRFGGAETGKDGLAGLCGATYAAFR
jgi:hypothetical protein